MHLSKIQRENKENHYREGGLVKNVILIILRFGELFALNFSKY